MVHNFYSESESGPLHSNGNAGPKANGVTAVKANGLVPTATKLSAATLASVPHHVHRFTYDRTQLRAGIVHIGVGNFFRAHEALYVEQCLHLPGQEAWGIVGIGTREGSENGKKGRAIQSQDCLYTLTEYTPNGDISARVVGSMIDYLHAPSDPQAALDRLASPETRIISLTITEGGYGIDEKTKEFVLSDASVQHDLANPSSPKSVFGYVVEAMARRRAAGLKGVTILSCDNLRSNGAVTRTAVLGFARARDSSLASWISENVSFPNSIVDRIAPAVGKAERSRANAHSGVADETPVISESFTQWVVEDDFVAGRPCFERVGVQLRGDVANFEVVKQRLLNGAHSMLAYPALMSGYRLVDEALRHQTVVSYLTAFMERDVIPFVGDVCPKGVDLIAYKKQIIERFSNPAVGDQLLRIASNGCAKFPVYLSNTFSGLLHNGGAYERAALCVACFGQYLQGSDMKGGEFTPDEPHLTTRDRELIASGDRYAALKLSAFATLGLEDDQKFRLAFDEARQRLAAAGPDAALAYAASA
ncbi:hypothetical protein Mapa_011843 [Marchantia paleacea]|nr:hypothetical protein Mapa_011843 [Marchantia paleacea]